MKIDIEKVIYLLENEAEKNQLAEFEELSHLYHAAQVLKKYQKYVEEIYQ